MKQFIKRKKNEEGGYEYDRFGRFSFDEYGENKDIFSNLDLNIIPKEPPKNGNVTSLNRTRLMAGFFFIVLLIFLLILRMGYWQIIKSDDLKDKAVSMQEIDTEINSVRGCIYDSKMNVLAETVTEYELYGYTHDLYKSDSLTQAEKSRTIDNMVEITGKDTKDILTLLEGDENLVLIAEGLSKEKVDKAQKLWDTAVVVKTKVARNYPNGAFAAQLLGGVNSENTGRSGLEYEYNTVLAGIKGRTVKTTDNQGNPLANGSSKYYQAQDGYHLVTTIDSVVQHYVEDALDEGMFRTGAAGISCIVMDPKTGKVLALAQTPEYNPNKSNRPSDKSEYNRFRNMSQQEQSDYLSQMWTIEQVSSIYEPGSTFKLIAAAAALETGNANDSSSYFCNGTIHVDDTDLHCLSHHGTQSLKQAVGNSCNAALARVALDMGADTFYNYIDLFGFNDPTGIDLPGETSSIVKNSEGMGNVDLATTGYGQGIAVTPLQVLCAVNSFGNKGVLLKPRVVDKIIDNDGKTVEKFDSSYVRQVISEETAEKMREIMEYYVSDAGGDKAYVPGFRVGGKTGTANIAANGGYSEKTDCSFIAMAPMDDPKVSMLVIVHKPTKTESGNYSAGPIVKSIMEKTLMYLGVEREYTEKEAVAAKKDKVTVPNVTGMDSKKAIALLTKNKLGNKIVAEGKSDKAFVVQDQYPKAGSKVERSTDVYLYSE